MTNTVKSVGNWVNENKKTIAKVAVGALAVAALVGITVLTGGAALAVAGSYLATATVFTAGFLAGGIVSKYAGSVISNIDRTDTFREASDQAAKATTKALPGIAITSAITGLLMPLGTPLVKEALRPLGLAATKFAASAFEGYADDAASVVDDFVDDASSAYAGAQSSGATQSGNAGTTACTEAGQAAGEVVGEGSNLAQLTRQSVQDKLARYLLNMEHSVGGSKAKWFKEALGYTQENLDDLANQISFDPNSAMVTEVTAYGTKYNQTIAITGANGKTIDIVFAWIKSAEDGVVRLVTAIPTK